MCRHLGEHGDVIEHRRGVRHHSPVRQRADELEEVLVGRAMKVLCGEDLADLEQLTRIEEESPPQRPLGLPVVGETAR